MGLYLWMHIYVCISLQGDGIRNFPSVIFLQWFYKQTQHHLPRSLFYQDISRKTLCSKFEAWGVFLASYIFTTSLLVWVLLCPMPPPRTHKCKLPLKPPVEHWSLSYVFYLPLLLLQNPAAVASRTEMQEIEKRSPLQCFCLLSCWAGQSFLYCKKIPANSENRRQRPWSKG